MNPAGARLGAAALVLAVVLAPARVASAEGAADRSLEPEPSAGLLVGWDARAEGSAIFKRYARSDGRDVWLGGPAGGAEVSLSLHFRPPPTPSGLLRWLDFECGVASALRYGSYADGAGRSTAFFENETAFVTALHLALRPMEGGRGADRTSVVVGLGWAPTAVYFFGSGRFASGGRFNPAGLRAMVDLGGDGGAQRPAVRLSVSWLPNVTDGPSEVTGGAGFVFY
jgi:hypothetical protein